MRCPVCRAENGLDDCCRRCRADLSLLVALESQRRYYLAQAARAANLLQGAETVRHAMAAHELRRGEDSRRLLALGSLFQRNFSLVWRHFINRDEETRQSS
jgi:hypothetical protein